MPLDTSNNYEISFEDPRLKMTLVGRLVVRIVGYVSYLVLAVAAFAFIINDLEWIRLSGVLLGLFLLDRFVHLYEADKPLSEFPGKGRVNLAHYLRPRAFGTIEKAFDRSLLTKQDFFLEVLHQLLHFHEIEEGLRRLDVNPDEFKQKVEEFLAESVKTSDGVSSSSAQLRVKTEALIVRAFRQALSASRRFIGITDLFAALPLVENAFISRLLNAFSLEAGDLERTLIFASMRRRLGGFWKIPKVLSGFVFESQRGLRHRVVNRAWTSRPTPTLDKYSVDLTDLAYQQQVGFLVGHAEEYERMVETLARPLNPNVLLVGEAGIGKETLVAHLAFLLVKDNVPPALFDKRLTSLQLNSLVAGSSPGDLQARVQKIVEEITIAGNVILYIPDIHNLVNTSGTAYLSAADALMPIIMNNTFPVIGATYPREFKNMIEPRSDFTGAFEIIRVNEISEEDAQRILIYESVLLERKSKVLISLGAIKTAVKLARKYFHNKFLPSSAEELLKSSLVDAERRKERALTPDSVIRTAETKVNVPIHEAGKEEAQKLLNLENIIHERLVDQEEAVIAVSNALRQYRSGLSRSGGPIAAFLFVGPTGVGKTELAKILTKVQFGSQDSMVRFDMTEYQDKQSFYRFIGSPDGKISGSLTEAILQKPYSLVLLDEFEKAFPDILNLFLQVFDDGRLTDNLGHLVDFTNTIIIATSNAHSDIINDSLNKGQSMSDIAEYLKRKLVDVFRPELLNRFSKIVVFKNLDPKDLEKIVALNLGDVADAVREQGILLSFDPAVMKRFVQLGYDPAFGARPLRRVIDEKLKAPLAEKILRKEIGRGGSANLVLKGDQLEIVPGAH